MKERKFIAGITAAAVLGLPSAAEASDDPPERHALEQRVTAYTQDTAAKILMEHSTADPSVRRLVQRPDGGVDVGIQTGTYEFVASYADTNRTELEGVRLKVEQEKTSYALDIHKADQDKNGVPGWRIKEQSLYLKNKTEGYDVEYTTETGLNKSRVWDKELFAAIVFQANWHLKKVGK